MTDVPTRWEQQAADFTEGRGYGARFAELHANGEDIWGEGRLADTLVARQATILDAGCGMGRVGAYLTGAGHRVVGVDLDAALLEQSRATFPDLPVMQSRLDHLTADMLREAGQPDAFDLIVCVGNVMILLAPDTEKLVLGRLAALLKPSGRLLVGFHLDARAPRSRLYPAADFEADAASAGLIIDAQFATYDLLPFDPEGEYAVSLLRAL